MEPKSKARGEIGIALEWMEARRALSCSAYEQNVSLVRVTKFGHAALLAMADMDFPRPSAVRVGCFDGDFWFRAAWGNEEISDLRIRSDGAHWISCSVFRTLKEGDHGYREARCVTEIPCIDDFRRYLLGGSG